MKPFKERLRAVEQKETQRVYSTLSVSTKAVFTAREYKIAGWEFFVNYIFPKTPAHPDNPQLYVKFNEEENHWINLEPGMEIYIDFYRFWLKCPANYSGASRDAEFQILIPKDGEGSDNLVDG